MQPETFQYTVANEKNIVRIWRAPLLNDWLSKKHKEQIYDSAIFIAVQVPGDNRQEFVTFVERTDPAGNVRVNKMYYDKYKEQIEKFKANRADDFEHGTPLAKLPFMDAALIENLKRLKVFTAEQFQSLEGVQLQAVGMGAQAMRDKVRAYLEANKNAVPFSKLSAENDELKAKLADLEAKVASLAEKPAKAKAKQEAA